MKFWVPERIARKLNSDSVFPTLSFINIIVCAFLLIFPSFQQEFRVGSAQVIGKVYYKDRESRRKLASQAVWQALDSNTEVYGFDTLKTWEGARTKIELADGTILEIGENSMVVLNISAGEQELEIVSGSLKIQRGANGAAVSKLRVKSGNAVLDLQAGEANLVKEDGELEVTVSNGEASLSNGGESVLLKSNQRAIVGKAALKKEALSIRLQSPADGVRLVTKENSEPVDFTWAGSAKEFVFELSTDRKFRRSVRRQTRLTAETTLELESGLYYWRVSKRGERAESSSMVRSFYVIRRAPPVLLSPKPNSVIGYNANLPAIHFNWNRSNSEGKYVLQISKSDDFRESENILVNSTGFTKFLAAGRYYWRVGAGRGDATLKSTVSQFQVSYSDRLSPPKPLYPVMNTSYRPELFRAGVSFNWSSESNVKEVELNIAADERFERIVHNKVSKASFSRVSQNLPPGIYFWRIRARQGGGWTEFSGTETFVIADEKAFIARQSVKPRVSKRASPVEKAVVVEPEGAPLSTAFKIPAVKPLPEFVANRANEKSLLSQTGFSWRSLVPGLPDYSTDNVTNGHLWLGGFTALVLLAAAESQNTFARVAELENSPVYRLGFGAESLLLEGLPTESVLGVLFLAEQRKMEVHSVYQSHYLRYQFLGLSALVVYVWHYFYQQAPFSVGWFPEAQRSETVAGDLFQKGGVLLGFHFYF